MEKELWEIGFAKYISAVNWDSPNEYIAAEKAYQAAWNAALELAIDLLEKTHG